MIRRATVNDLVSIVKLGRTFYEQAGFSEFQNYDEKRCFKELNAFLHSSLVRILVFEMDGQVRGIAGFHLVRMFFSSTLVGIELFFYIEPEYRGPYGLTFFKALEVQARICGAVSLTMYTLEAKNPRATGRFYARQGYKPVEHGWTKKLQEHRGVVACPECPDDA